MSGPEEGRRSGVPSEAETEANEAPGRRYQDRFMRLFQRGPIPMALSDMLDATFVDVNERWCEVTGYDRDELLGRSSLELGLWSDPSVRVAIREEMETRGRVDNFRVQFIRRDGERREALGSVQRVVFDERPLWFSTLYDVTEQVLAERERARMAERRIALERMAAIGELAGGVAHDINNLLLPILVNTDLALPDAPDELRSELEEIREAALRGRDLTRKLLTFARQQTLQKRSVHLSEVLRSAEGMLRRMVPESTEIVVRTGDDEGDCIHADPAQIEQILVSLVANARDAVAGHGRITLSTYIRNEPEDADVGVDDGEGPHVYLVVEDDGPGIPDDIRDRVFEPFFSTKDEMPSAGLGLSSVLGVVEQHDGHLRLESDGERGTRVLMGFPTVEAPGPADGTEAADRRAGSDGGRAALVVEDDDAVRRVTSRVLRAYGYEVLQAESGPTALEMLESHGSGVDIIITDMVMPGMTGLELRERVRETAPDIPVVFVSGYGWGVLAEQGLDARDETILQKPFTPDQLIDAVDEALAEGTAPS